MKISAKAVTLLTIFVLSQQISAAECIPQDQLTEEDKYVGGLKGKCVQSIKNMGYYKIAELTDGTLLIFGIEMESKNTNKITVPAILPRNQRKLEKYESVQEKNPPKELLETKMSLLTQHLVDLKSDGPCAYETSECLFANLKNWLEKTDWSSEENQSLHDLLNKFARSVVLTDNNYGGHWRFGVPILETLSQLANKYPYNTVIYESLRIAVGGAVSIGEKYISESPWYTYTDNQIIINNSTRDELINKMVGFLIRKPIDGVTQNYSQALASRLFILNIGTDDLEIVRNTE